VTRYYLTSCEFKWSHAGTQMENVWVQRELGDELYKQCNQTGFNLVTVHSNSQTLPEDMYCRCDVYVDVADSKQSLLFALQGHQEVPPA
jgi:hypothetical protein